MTLTDLARELLTSDEESSGRRSDLPKAVVAGALLLAPLSAAAALFGSAPTLDLTQSPSFLTRQSDSTTAQVLDGGSHLKIFGTASTVTTSGAGYTHVYRWQGDWAEAPTLGQSVNLHAEATAAFGAVDPSQLLESSWTLSLDLDADGTAEYTTGDSSKSSTIEGFPILVDALVLATTAGASNYRLDLTFSQTFSETVGALAPGVTLTIPENSIDLVIPGRTVPEPSTLALIFGAAGLYRLGSRRKK